MPVQIMERRASDNKYLHRDFHVAMKLALDYCHSLYGDEGVRQYLRQFASAYFQPLRAQMKDRGLVPLRDYFTQIYAAEEAEVDIVLEDAELTVRVPRCPAVTYLRKMDHDIPAYYDYTTTVVYEELCRDTGVTFVLDEYDRETGRCAMRFTRKAGNAP